MLILSKVGYVFIQKELPLCKEVFGIFLRELN